jgi:hypothetical protein
MPVVTRKWLAEWELLHHMANLGFVIYRYVCARPLTPFYLLSDSKSSPSLPRVSACIFYRPFKQCCNNMMIGHVMSDVELLVFRSVLN